MAGVNKVILVGNVGADPELRYTQSGIAVANFSLAANETWNDANGEKQQRTEWIRCVAWQRLGEIVGEFVKKGKQLYIEGRLQTRKWEDKDGNDRWTTEVIVRNLQLLGSANGNGNRPPEPPPIDPDGGPVSIPDDDIPF